MTNEFDNFCGFVENLLKEKVNYTMETTAGRKYHKVIMVTCGGQRSVWCFVDKTTGDIFKPATWKAPAKHSRGNITKPETYQGYDWTGPHYLR